MNKATLSNRVEIFNPNHRIESGLHRSIKVFNLDRMDTPHQREIIDCRIYWPGVRVYCCLWVKGDTWRQGSGFAGGYGYCKESAAIDAAINNAGFDLAKSVSGCGIEAAKEALEAVARAYGAKRPFIVEAYA